MKIGNLFVFAMKYTVKPVFLPFNDKYTIQFFVAMK